MNVYCSWNTIDFSVNDLIFQDSCENLKKSTQGGKFQYDSQNSPNRLS